MQSKEEEKNRYKIQWNKQKAVVMLCLLIFSFFTYNYWAISGVAIQNNITCMSTNSEIFHKEIIVEGDNYHLLGTKMAHEKSIIHVNYTVLAISNTSVVFDYYDLWENNLNTTLWSPHPQNFTLAPGESFADNFTLLLGPVE